jgi:hypothetical protein
MIQSFDGLLQTSQTMFRLFTWRKRKQSANSAKHLAELYGWLLRREPPVDGQILQLILASLTRLVQFEDIRQFMSRVSMSLFFDLFYDLQSNYLNPVWGLLSKAVRGKDERLIENICHFLARCTLHPELVLNGETITDIVDSAQLAFGRSNWTLLNLALIVLRNSSFNKEIKTRLVSNGKSLHARLYSCVIIS